MTRPGSAAALDRALNAPPPLGLDDAMLRRLERALRHVEPDPLFRRRLRGEVLNRYVAAREGHLEVPRGRREMGTIGRAVLYASLVLAISVSAAGAAAQDSLPGDLLYTTKLQLEEIRIRIAPPSIRDDLAAIVLAERTEELEQLASTGSWSLVPAAAARVIAAEEALLARGPASSAQVAGPEQGTIETLEAVLERAPEAARPGLERALVAVGGRSSPDDQPAVHARPAYTAGGQGSASPSAPPAEATVPPAATAPPAEATAPPATEQERPSPGKHHRFETPRSSD